MKYLKELWKTNSWLYLRVGMGVLIVVMFLTLFILVFQKQPLAFDSVGIQSHIENSERLGQLVRSNVPAASQQVDTYYRLGRMYAKAIAFTISNDVQSAQTQLDNIIDLSQEHEKIPTIIKELRAPLKHMDKKSLIYLYRLLQDELEAMAKSNGKQSQSNFYLGAWSVDVLLLAGVNEKGIVYQLRKLLTRQAVFLHDNTESGEVRETLQQLVNYFQNPQPSDEWISNIQHSAQALINAHN